MQIWPDFRLLTDIRWPVFRLLTDIRWTDILAGYPVSGKKEHRIPGKFTIGATLEKKLIVYSSGFMNLYKKRTKINQDIKRQGY